MPERVARGSHMNPETLQGIGIAIATVLCGAGWLLLLALA